MINLRNAGPHPQRRSQNLPGRLSTPATDCFCKAVKPSPTPDSCGPQLPLATGDSRFRSPTATAVPTALATTWTPVPERRRPDSSASPPRMESPTPKPDSIPPAPTPEPTDYPDCPVTHCENDCAHDNIHCWADPRCDAIAPGSGTRIRNQGDCSPKPSPTGLEITWAVRFPWGVPDGAPEWVWDSMNGQIYGESTSALLDYPRLRMAVRVGDL